jgi:hypothetical protein
MSFKVLVNPRAEEKLKALPEASRKEIAGLLDTLQENPVPVETFDIKKLRGYIQSEGRKVQGHPCNLLG